VVGAELHRDVDGLDVKIARAAKEGTGAWVDPEGYKTFVASQKAKFDTRARWERAVPTAAGKS
jgi:hypothetical protein